MSEALVARTTTRLVPFGLGRCRRRRLPPPVAALLLSSGPAGGGDEKNGGARSAAARRAARAEAREALRSAFAAEEARRQALVREDWLGEGDDAAVRAAHLEAVAAGRLSYDDPGTGLKVLTTWSHFLRGRCCGNACRHCIYGHQEVPVAARGGKVFNSAFWKNRPEVDRDSSDGS